MTEQSAPDSVSAAIDAMDQKLFGSEEPEQEQTESTSEPEAADVDTEDSTDNQSTEDESDAEQPGEPNDPEQLRALMTRKTQEASRQMQEARQLNELAVDRRNFVEAYEQIGEAVSEAKAQLLFKQQQLKQLDAADMSQYDDTTRWRLFQEAERLRREIDRDSAALSQAKPRLDAMRKAHEDKQWELSIKAFKERVPTVTAKDDAAMLRQVEKLGLSTAVVKARYNDPAILEAFYKAAKYDEALSGKTKALNTARQAPPVVKPGSTDPAMSAKMRDLNLAKQMKNAKSTKEKVSLAEQRMARFFG